MTPSTLRAGYQRVRDDGAALYHGVLRHYQTHQVEWECDHPHRSQRFAALCATEHLAYCCAAASSPG